MSGTGERIARLLSRDFGVSERNTTPGTRLNELGFDSLDWPDFWFSIETRCGVEIDEQDPAIVCAGTLGELAEAIDKIKARRAA